jgi:hypothetical protein
MDCCRKTPVVVSVSCLFILSGYALLSGAEVPTDNPVATFYSGAEGYPAWTDRIRWENVVNMATYDKGNTNFGFFRDFSG